jgi:hypothetical protein
LKIILLERLDTTPPVGTVDYQAHALATNALLKLLHEFGVKPSANVDAMFSPVTPKQRTIGMEASRGSDGPVETPQKSLEQNLDAAAGETPEGFRHSAPAFTSRGGEAGLPASGLELPKGPWQDSSAVGSIAEFGKALVQMNKDNLTAIMSKVGSQHINKDGTEKLRPTIKVQPHLKWPILEDNDNDVEEFFDGYEEVCQLPNDGMGMEFREKLQVLPTTLRGYRLKTFMNCYKIHRHTLVQTDPTAVYIMIKDRLL